MSGIFKILFAMLLFFNVAGVQAIPRHLSMMGATSCLAYLKAQVPGWERQHPGYTVSISGGGSVAGIVEVSQGRVDVGVSDIPSQSQWTGGMALRAYLLGRLPILFIAHPGTGITNLSSVQLGKIFEGRVSNWRAVGGRSVPMVVITRPFSSGSLGVVQGRLLQGRRVTGRAIVELSNGAMLAAVRETPGAIGFLESGWAPSGVRTLSINHQPYRASGAANSWPYYAEPRLLVRRDASSMVISLARYLATRPDRSRFGIFGAGS